MIALVTKTARRLGPLVRLTAHDTTTEEGRSRERYRRATLTSLASGLSKIISIGAGLVSVRLTLRYLGTERYGLWMTISSLISVLGFSDLGINNSLMNGIAKAYGRDDRKLARQYVSSAFVLLVGISAVLGVVAAIGYPWVPWGRLLHVHSADAAAQVGPAIAVFTACFLLNIPAGIPSRVQMGYQEGFIANLWTSLGSVFSVVALLWVIHVRGSLALLVLAMAGAPIVALLLNGVLLFGVKRPWLRPSLHAVEKPVSKDLMHLGGLFLVLQIAYAVSFSSDNIVLNSILGADAVTQYAVPSRLFSLIAVITSFATAPLWPAYGEAVERQDHAWIRRTLTRSLTGVTGVAVILSAGMALLGQRIIRLWVGPQIHVSGSLLTGLAIWGVLGAFSGALAMFLNGMSIIRYQAITSICAAAMNISLSIYLTKRIGIPGVIYGSIISQIVAIILPSFWYLRRYVIRDVSVGTA